jgi:hypothetical protein
MPDPQFASETRITTQLPLDPFRVIANEQITGITNMITHVLRFVNLYSLPTTFAALNPALLLSATSVDFGPLRLSGAALKEAVVVRKFLAEFVAQLPKTLLPHVS